MLSQQQLIESVLAGCSDCIALFSSDHRLLHATQAYCQFIGFELSDIQNMHISVFSDQTRYLTQLKPALTLALTQGRTVQHPLSHLTISNNKKQALFQGALFKPTNTCGSSTAQPSRHQEQDNLRLAEVFTPIFNDNGQAECVMQVIKMCDATHYAPTPHHDNSQIDKRSNQGIDLRASKKALTSCIKTPLNILHTNIEILEEYIDLLKGFIRTSLTLKHTMPARTRQKIEGAYSNFQVLTILNDTPQLFSECATSMGKINHALKDESTHTVQLSSGHTNLHQCIHNAIQPNHQHLVTVHINQKEPCLIAVNEVQVVQLLNSLINHLLNREINSAACSSMALEPEPTNQKCYQKNSSKRPKSLIQNHASEPSNHPQSNHAQSNHGQANNGQPYQTVQSVQSTRNTHHTKPIDVLLHSTDENHFVLLRSAQHKKPYSDSEKRALSNVEACLKDMGGELLVTSHEQHGLTLTVTLPKTSTKEQKTSNSQTG